MRRLAQLTWTLTLAGPRSQFHPESNQWDPGEERGGQLVPARSLPAIQSVQYLANFFVEVARNNTHRYPTGIEESEDLIAVRGTLQMERGGGAIFPEGNYLFSKSIQY